MLCAAIGADRGIPWTSRGGALATLGLGLLAAGLTQEPGNAVLALAGLAILAVFVGVEARSAHPMMPLKLFRDRNFAAASLATFALYAALSAVLFYLPMLLIAGWGLSELLTSVAFAPLSVAIFLLSSQFGAVADRTGPGRLIASGAAPVAVGYAWLALTLGWWSFWAGVVPPMLVAGLGMAMVVAPLSAAVMGGVPEDDSGAASGINNAVSRVAGLLAAAMLGPVAASVYASSGGSLSYGEVGQVTGHADAMTRAFAVVAWIASALAALSALLAVMGPRRSRPTRAT